MELRLCFCTFASVLNKCRDMKKINQEKFVTDILKILIPQIPYEKYPNYKEDIIEYDKAAISKILSAQKNIPFSSALPLKPIDEIKKEFSEKIVPYFSEDNKTKIILALRDIILNDNHLDFDFKESFNLYYGITKDAFAFQYEFSFTELLSKTLLFTIESGVENIEGRDCIKSITKEYIDEVQSQFQFDIKWDNNEQKLTLTYIKNWILFNELLTKYKLFEFIEKVDPSYRISDDWVELVDGFLQEAPLIIKKSWNEKNESINTEILNGICDFYKTLDQYITYVGKNVLLSLYNEDSQKRLAQSRSSNTDEEITVNSESLNNIDSTTNTKKYNKSDDPIFFIPKKDINPFIFIKETKSYRESLISIYEKMVENLKKFTISSSMK